MKTCQFCGSEFPDERPFAHCMAEACVQRHLAERSAAMTVNLVPKVGYVPAYINDVRGVSGRSSGR